MGRDGEGRAGPLDPVPQALLVAWPAFTSCGDNDLIAWLEGEGGSVRGIQRSSLTAAGKGTPSFSVCARVHGHVTQVTDRSPQALCQFTSKLERLLCI